MESVQVTGRFVSDTGTPIDGHISFYPSKLWVEDEAGVIVAPRAYDQFYLTNGGFLVNLTRTDQGEHDWHYTVKCPVGEWSIRVDRDGPVFLKSLLPKRFA